MNNGRQFFIAVLLLMGAIFIIRYMDHGEVIPFKKKLDDFPMSIASFQGKDLGMDEEVLEKLRLSDYLMREYRSSDGKNLSLYIGYYQSQREGSTYHSPKNCLPGSGWEIVRSETINAPEKAGGMIRINKMLIQKGIDKQLVIYWYHDRGRIIASEYWAKIYLVLDAITLHRTDGALVRIIMPLDESSDEPPQYGMSFIAKLIPVLSEFLPAG